MDQESRRIWGYRAAFILIALAIITYRLLPIGPAGGALVTPDLLLALTIAWLLRQPSFVPIGSVVIVFLLADFLLQRPPGLWTALVLMMTEFLRFRRTALTEINFLIEWSWVAGAVFVITVVERFALWVLLAPQTSLGLSLVHALVTVAVYPIIVLISHYVFGLRKLGPADAETT